VCKHGVGAGPQAIALAGHLNNGCVREKAVENGRGRRRTCPTFCNSSRSSPRKASWGNVAASDVLTASGHSLA